MSVYYDLYQNPPQEGKEEELLHARVVPKGTISTDKFLEIVHNATGFSQAILDGTLQAVTDELHRWLANGWIVEVGELGHFSLSLKCDRPVKDKKEIRSPSVRLQSVNLRVSNKFRKRFASMELERKSSPYVSHSGMPQSQRVEKLMEHLEKHGCIQRSDYELLVGVGKYEAVADLNRYIDEGLLRRYGSGKNVVYLKKEVS